LAASVPLFALLLGFNLLVDALQDAFDPKQGFS
jgi:ABC-type dipeptide/oligopeptide/nickel transport system permease subunit